jgi:hypothetical protein
VSTLPGLEERPSLGAARHRIADLPLGAAVKLRDPSAVPDIHAASRICRISPDGTRGSRRTTRREPLRDRRGPAAWRNGRRRFLHFTGCDREQGRMRSTTSESRARIASMPLSYRYRETRKERACTSPNCSKQFHRPSTRSVLPIRNVKGSPPHRLTDLRTCGPRLTTRPTVDSHVPCGRLPFGLFDHHDTDQVDCRRVVSEIGAPSGAAVRIRPSTMAGWRHGNWHRDSRSPRSPEPESPTLGDCQPATCERGPQPASGRDKSPGWLGATLRALHRLRRHQRLANARVPNIPQDRLRKRVH